MGIISCKRLAIQPRQSINYLMETSSDSLEKSEDKKLSAEERAERMDKMEPLIRDLLSTLGEDVDREGLIKTPSRVARSFMFLTEGYRMNLSEIVNEAVFHETCDDM